MIFARLICNLPRWLGGGHRWRRLVKNERENPGIQIMAKAHLATVETLRICRRCGAERIAKPRTTKAAAAAQTQETHNETGT